MRVFKFRAWHEGAAVMIYEDTLGDVFKWKNEGLPIIIEQFTGIQDSQGKDIFEGDILEYYNSWGTKETIIVKEGQWKKRIFEGQNAEIREVYHIGFKISGFNFILGKAKIIGNIHQKTE